MLVSSSYRKKQKINNNIMENSLLVVTLAENIHNRVQELQQKKERLF